MVPIACFLRFLPRRASWTTANLDLSKRITTSLSPIMAAEHLLASEHRDLTDGVRHGFLLRFGRRWQQVLSALSPCLSIDLLQENQEEMDPLAELYSEHKERLYQIKLTQDLKRLRAFPYLRHICSARPHTHHCSVVKINEYAESSYCQERCTITPQDDIRTKVEGVKQ